ncbi:MAG: alpha/beta fold hydrolase [Lachnospiraceae bacterium]|nr:alpha/beta fold hydrolase [Lachnospiraceae bacterium]
MKQEVLSLNIFEKTAQFPLKCVLKKSDGAEIPVVWNFKGRHHTVLICLHGFGGDKDSSVISALREDLDKEGIGVITFDWPAHGESNAKDSEFTVERCQEDLDAVVGFVRQITDGLNKKISCFATSFGGYIATLYRNRHPGVFKHLILRSPAFKMADVLKKIMSVEDFSKLRNGEQVLMGFERKMQIGKEFYESLLANPVYDTPVEDPLQVMILQGYSDDIVDPDDTISYAKRNHICLQIFYGTDHRYKKPGELKKIVRYTEQFLTMVYSESIYDKIYRVYSGVNVDVWDEKAGKWRMDEYAPIRYTDILGGGGGWDKYDNMKREEAWQRIRRLGGTIDEFVKGW